MGTATQAVLLLTCPAGGLAAGNRSCFIPVATNPWPAFAAVRDQPPQSCHGISCACTTRPAPGRISALALHVQSPGRPHEMPSRGRQCSTSGREEGRFLPLKVNASMTEFAPSLTCISNKTQSTPVLTPPHSEDVKENVHRNLEEQKRFFFFFYSRCLCKEMGQVLSLKSQSRSILFQSKRCANLITQWCLLALGDVPFAWRSTQALSGPRDILVPYFPPTTSLAARRPPPCTHTARWAAPALPNTLLCFWMLGTQAAGRIR